MISNKCWSHHNTTHGRWIMAIRFRLRWRSAPVSWEFQLKTRLSRRSYGRWKQLLASSEATLPVDSRPSDLTDVRLFVAMISMLDKMENDDKKSWVGVLQWPSFLSESLRLPKKLDLRRTSLAKKCWHVGNHVNFSSMFELLHQLQCKPWPMKNPFCSLSYCSIPLWLLVGALLQHSLKQP